MCRPSSNIDLPNSVDPHMKMAMKIIEYMKHMEEQMASQHTADHNEIARVYATMNTCLADQVQDLQRKQTMANLFFGVAILLFTIMFTLL